MRVSTAAFVTVCSDSPHVLNMYTHAHQMNYICSACLVDKALSACSAMNVRVIRMHL